MNIFKKTISLFLILVLVFSTGITVFAGEKPEFHYVSLGSSMTSAFGMRYYMDPAYYEHPETINQRSHTVSGYRNSVEGSYPDLIRDALEEIGYDVDWDQLAQSSMRCEELRFLLDEDYKGDEYTAWRFYNEKSERWWNADELVNLRKDYRDSIREADLITYELGINNFGVYLANRLLSKDYGADFGKLFPSAWADTFYNLRDKVENFVISKVNDSSILTKETFEEIDFYADTFAYALLGFMINFDATIKEIRNLNPDCDLIVMAIPNPIGNLDLRLEQLNISLTDLYSFVLKLANTYMERGSLYSKRYLYVDHTGKKGYVTSFLDEIKNYDGNPDHLSQNILDCFNVYDSSLQISAQVAPVITLVVGEENRDAVLKDVYHTVATIFKAAANIDTIDADKIFASISDLDAATNELTEGIKGMVVQTALKSCLQLKNPGSEMSSFATPEEMVERFIGPETPEVRRFLAAVAVRIVIGNSFFAHPNEVGHKETFDAIWEAWEKPEPEEQNQAQNPITQAPKGNRPAQVLPAPSLLPQPSVVMSAIKKGIDGLKEFCEKSVEFWTNPMKKLHNK